MEMANVHVLKLIIVQWHRVLHGPTRMQLNKLITKCEGGDFVFQTYIRFGFVAHKWLISHTFGHILLNYSIQIEYELDSYWIGIGFVLVSEWCGCIAGACVLIVRLFVINLIVGHFVSVSFNSIITWIIHIFALESHQFRKWRNTYTIDAVQVHRWSVTMTGNWTWAACFNTHPSGCLPNASLHYSTSPHSIAQSLWRALQRLRQFHCLHFIWYRDVYWFLGVH